MKRRRFFFSVSERHETMVRPVFAGLSTSVEVDVEIINGSYQRREMKAASLEVKLRLRVKDSTSQDMVKKKKEIEKSPRVV